MNKFLFGATVFALVLDVGLGRANEAWPIHTLFERELIEAPSSKPAKTPGTSQPIWFDPSKYRAFHDLRKVSNFQSKSIVRGNNGMSVEIYYFDTDDDASYVLAVFYRGKRVALYTQVLNFRTIANNNVLVFENLVEQEDKTWLLKRRVGALADRKFVSFPDLNCTKFLAPDPVSGLVTYGAGTKIGDSFGPPREVCIWNENLQLQHALSVPIQNMLANSEETPNSIGLLPADKNTFYQLAFDKDHCVMRLQSLINKDNYRQIKLPMGQTYTDVTEAVITGAYGDPCWNDVAIQFDISNLTFSGGNMRFRISKSSRGDLKHDWSAWQTYQ